MRDKDEESMLGFVEMKANRIMKRKWKDKEGMAMSIVG